MIKYYRSNSKWLLWKVHNDNKALHFHLFNPAMERIVNIKERILKKG